MNLFNLVSGDVLANGSLAADDELLALDMGAVTLRVVSLVVKE